MKLSHQLRYAAYKLASEVDPSLGLRNMISNLKNFVTSNYSPSITKTAVESSQNRFFYSKSGQRYSSKYKITTGNSVYKYLPLQGPPLAAGALEGVPQAYPNLDRFSLSASKSEEQLSDSDLESIIATDSKIIADPARWYGLNEEVNDLFNNDVRKYNVLVKEEHKLRDTAGRTDNEFQFVLRPLILATLINMRIHEQDKSDVVADFMKRFLAPQVRIPSDKLSASYPKGGTVCKLVYLLKPSSTGGFATAYIRQAVRSVAIDYLRRKARLTRGEVFYEGSEYAREGSKKDEAFSQKIREIEQAELRRSSPEEQFNITEARAQKLKDLSRKINPLELEFPYLSEEEKYPTSTVDMKRIFSYLEDQKKLERVNFIPAKEAVIALNESLSNVNRELESATADSIDSLQAKKIELEKKIKSLRPLAGKAVGLYEKLNALQANHNYLTGYLNHLSKELESFPLYALSDDSPDDEKKEEIKKEYDRLREADTKINIHLSESLELINDIRRSLPRMVTNQIDQLSDIYKNYEAPARENIWDTGEVELNLINSLADKGITGVEYQDFDASFYTAKETKYPDPMDLYYALERSKNPDEDNIAIQDFKRLQQQEHYDKLKSKRLSAEEKQILNSLESNLAANKEKYKELGGRDTKDLSEEEKLFVSNHEKNKEYYERLHERKLTPEEEMWVSNYEKRPKEESIDQLEEALKSPGIINFRSLMNRVHKNINLVRLYPGEARNSAKNIMGRVILRLLLKILIFGEHNFSLARRGTRITEAKSFESALNQTAEELAKKLPSKDNDSEDDKTQRAYKILLREPEIFFSSLSAEIKPIDIQRFISLTIRNSKEYYDLLTPEEKKAAEKGHLFFSENADDEKRLNAAQKGKEVETKLRKISNEKFKKLMETLYSVILVSFKPDKKVPETAEEKSTQEGKELISQHEVWEDLKEHLFSPYTPEDPKKKRIVQRMEETYGSSNLFDYLAMGEKDDLKPTIFMPAINSKVKEVWDRACEVVRKDYLSQSIPLKVRKKVKEQQGYIKELRAILSERLERIAQINVIRGIKYLPPSVIVKNIKDRGTIYQGIDSFIYKDEHGEVGNCVHRIIDASENPRKRLTDKEAREIQLKEAEKLISLLEYIDLEDPYIPKALEDLHLEAEQREDDIKRKEDYIDSLLEKYQSDLLSEKTNAQRTILYKKYKEKIESELSDLIEDSTDSFGSFKYATKEDEERIYLLESFYADTKYEHGDARWIKETKYSREKERYLIFIQLLKEENLSGDLVIGQMGKTSNLLNKVKDYPDLWEEAGEKAELIEKLKSKPKNIKNIISVKGREKLISAFDGLKLENNKVFKRISSDLGEGYDYIPLTTSEEEILERIYKSMLALANPVEMRKNYQRETGNNLPILQEDIYDIVSNEVSKDGQLQGSFKKIKGYQYFEVSKEEKEIAQKNLLQAQKLIDEDFSKLIDQGYDSEEAYEIVQARKNALSVEDFYPTAAKDTIKLEKNLEDTITSLIAERLYQQDLPSFVNFIKSSRKIKVRGVNKEEQESASSAEDYEEDVQRMADMMSQGETISKDAESISENNEEIAQNIIRYTELLKKPVEELNREETRFLETFKDPGNPETPHENNTLDNTIEKAKQKETQSEKFEAEEDIYEEDQGYEDQDYEDQDYVDYSTDDRGY